MKTNEHKGDAEYRLGRDDMGAKRQPGVISDSVPTPRVPRSAQRATEPLGDRGYAS